MNNHTERIFKWIDIIRWVLYGIVMGAIGGAVWATKIQLSLSDLRSDVEALVSKEVPEEHRFTAIEKDVEWVKREVPAVRK